MAKNMTTNKEVVKNEKNYMLSLLRNAIAFNGKDRCTVYLAGVHKETEAQLEAMGIVIEKKKNWGHILHAPKKGTKAYKTLFEGSNVLAEAKAQADAKVAAAKAEKAEKAAKAKAKAEAKAAKEKEAKAKAAAKEKAAKEKAKAEKPKTEKKAAKAPAKKAEKKAAKAPAKKVVKTETVNAGNAVTEAPAEA
jgi:hypothetical protein